jgi:LysR family nitrogen assimilation transcriptional regulator
MDLQKIRYFLAVMEHRNLSLAAQALRVSQPTLSRQMRALEEEFAAALFVRSGRGVAPTDSAVRLHEGLSGLERQLRSLKSEVAAASTEPTGEVAFGIPPSPRTLLAIPVIQRFASLYPRVVVRVAEETSGELRDRVAAGVLDIAITNLDEPMRGVVAEPLGREQMLLIGPRNAWHLSQREVPVEELAEVPLILTTRPNSLRLLVESSLGSLGLRPNVRVEANTLPLMTDLVEAGLGYTILPSCGVRDLVRSGKIAARPIAGFAITWLLAKPKSRSLNVTAERFCDVLHELARETVAKGVWLDAKPDGGVQNQRRRSAAAQRWT